jgi:hypothetical protein
VKILAKNPSTKSTTAKKPTTKNTTTKSEERSMPKTILPKLKQIKNKFFKEDEIKDVKEKYWKIFDEQKEKYKNTGWSDTIIHKRSIAVLKNQKKREKLGGTLDKYYGLVLGSSKTRDMYSNKKLEIYNKWKEDPEGALDEGLIMTRTEVNPATGEEERVPILDKDGSIVPRDNREYYTLSDKSKRKNTNYDKPLRTALIKTIVGACVSVNSIDGVFIMELRDEQTELEIPYNVPVKFSARTTNSEVIEIENKYIDKSLLEDMIESLKDDIEQDIITEGYAKNVEKYYNNLLSEETLTTTVFKLRSSKSSYFERIDDEELKFCEPLLSDDGGYVDINEIYKKYFYPFTADCSNLLAYHEDNQYLDKDKKNVNWDELVSLQDVNALTINTEASLSGNYSIIVEDDTLFNNDITHNDKEVDGIRLIVPDYIKLDFAQDDRINVIGSLFQFQARDEENKDMYEEITDENGKTTKIPILDYPSIMVYGIHPIAPYKNEVETIDMTKEDDEIGEMEIEKESDELTEEELKDMEDAVKENQELDETEDILGEEELAVMQDLKDDDIW